MGALSELPLALGSRTPVLVFCGELTAAASLVEEAHSVREATGINEAPYGALILAAWRGQAREARELIEVTMREATSRGEGVGVAISEYAHAVLCNGLGQYEEALVAARRACADPQEMVAHNWGLTELVESATRTGNTDLATDALQTAGQEGTGERNRLGARDGGAGASPAQRGRRRRGPIPRSGRTFDPRTGPGRTRPHSPAVRGVAATG